MASCQFEIYWEGPFWVRITQNSMWITIQELPVGRRNKSLSLEEEGSRLNRHVCPCPYRWTHHSWEALACWTRHLSCAALRPTRFLQYSLHRLAPTMPSGWPASSGLPTGMLSLWPMTGRSTASWSNTAVCCPGCLFVLYCLGRRCSALTRTGLLFAACPPPCRPGAMARSVSLAHASWGQTPHGRPIDLKAHIPLNRMWTFCHWVVFPCQRKEGRARGSRRCSCCLM